MGIIRKKAGTEHIDTNIIIRLIVGDSPSEYQRVQKLLSKKHKIFVFEDAAMMEVVFVLSKVYKYSREEVVSGINLISKFENIYYNKSLIEDALNIYLAHPKLSFVDCYLTVITQLTDEIPLWTLDKKLASQCPLARLP